MKYDSKCVPLFNIYAHRQTDASLHLFIAPDISHICAKLQVPTSFQSKDICTQTFAWSIPLLHKGEPHVVMALALKNTPIHIHAIKASSKNNHSLLYKLVER